MKKVYTLLIVVALILVLTSCSEDKAVPLRNPEVELFSLFYDGIDYEILKRNDTGVSAVYIINCL